MNQARGAIQFLLALFLVFVPVQASAASPASSNEDPSGKPAKAPAAAVTSPSTSGNAAAGRVVVLGFDGADARTVEELLRSDPTGERYPTFRKLKEQGTFAPLNVVTPAESPVSWASLNSGQNPGKTGVPGFIKRELGANPTPNFGHLEKAPKPLAHFDNPPINTWSATVTGLVYGGGAFLVLLLVGWFAFGKRLAPALVLALIGAGGGGYYGKTLRGYLPENYPRVSNVIQVRSFWDYAADADVPCVILDAAQVFDVESPPAAKVLAGLGVPDARGEIGNWFIYTTDPEEYDPEGRGTSTAGTVYRVNEYEGEILANVYGPPNFWLEERLKQEKAQLEERLADPNLSWEKTPEVSNRIEEVEAELRENARGIPLEMRIQLASDSATISLAGQTHTLEVGQWSPFYELSFELNSLLKVDAITRVKLVQLEPYFELYVNVLDIDPRNPPFWQAISSPPGFAAELVADCDRLYETYGWPTPTMPFKDKEISPELMLEDVEFTMKWREDVTASQLAKNDWKCLMSVFSTTDRVQHMMYQFYDREHPLYDPEKANKRIRFFDQDVTLHDSVPVIYQQMDRVIGEVLDKLSPEDTLIVCSDHGFQSFRRQVHLNNWLIQEGYMKARPTVTSMPDALLYVDWAQTKIYSLGLGFLYVNMKGREQNGIVDPADADALMREVRQKLMAATDPETGEKICDTVYIVKDEHSGDHIDLEADMIAGFRPPYRVGWSSAFGGVELVKEEETGLKELAPICSDNMNPWSGGHVSMSLPSVAGVFFSNKKVDIPSDGVKALHIAPTVLSLLGVAVPAEMDEEPLSIR